VASALLLRAVGTRARPLRRGSAEGSPGHAAVPAHCCVGAGPQPPGRAIIRETKHLSKPPAFLLPEAVWRAIKFLIVK